MITLTALNDLRCSIRPELVVSVEAGASTMVLLQNGLVLAVRESVDEVRRRLTTADHAPAVAPSAQGRHDGHGG